MIFHYYKLCVHVSATLHVTLQILCPPLLFAFRAWCQRKKCRGSKGSDHNPSAHPEQCTCSCCFRGISQICRNKTLKLSNTAAHIIFVAMICYQFVLQLHQPSIGMIIPALKFAFPKFQNNRVFQKVQYVRIPTFYLKKLAGFVHCFFRSFLLQLPNFDLATNDKAKGFMIV